ncbi:hypothetical protein EA798_04310 [Pseudomonas songnenensis]|jgi:hypothetical protein|uniref:Uncharacterized protein n=1 Tax=Pseudomonas songnenensis TaxID=1176259 RepID=A0ABX9V2G6_9PSED|nr:hypothetical protein EA798_04310 [Pseudomonas songnenensis]
MLLPSLKSETGGHYTQKPARRFCTLSQLKLLKHNGKLDLLVPNPNNSKLAVLSRLAASDTGSV